MGWTLVRFVTMAVLCYLDMPTAPIRPMGNSILMKDFVLPLSGHFASFDIAMCEGAFIYRSAVLLIALVSVPLYLVGTLSLLVCHPAYCAGYWNEELNLEETLQRINEYACTNEMKHVGTLSLPDCSADDFRIKMAIHRYEEGPPQAKGKG